MRVAFQTVAKIGRLLPADVALEFSLKYENVVVFGEVSILVNKDKAKAVLQKLLDKYFSHLTPDIDYRSTTDNVLKRITMYKLKIDKWTGKKKLAIPDFAGAFYSEKMCFDQFIRLMIMTLAFYVTPGMATISLAASGASFGLKILKLF